VSRVLFVCVHNAGRSQMSQALFNRAAADAHEARSAGSEPAARVHPEVVAAMDEVGLDLRGDEAVRATRDEIDRRITGLLAELDA
jgi:arsenate reductase (thioredoxin)